MAFLGPDHIGLDPLAGDAADIRKCLGVDQGDQPMKGIGLSLVWGGRKQQEIRCGLGKPLAQFEPGHLVGAATETVGFVHDDQVPTGGDQVLEPFPVVLSHLLCRPAAALSSGLTESMGQTTCGWLCQMLSSLAMRR